VLNEIFSYVESFVVFLLSIYAFHLRCIYGLKPMGRKNFHGMLAVFLFFVLLSSTASEASLASELSAPSRLQVYVGPPKVLADSGVYDSVLVQLQDSRSMPARAPEDVIVRLSSSRTDVGSVDPTVTIRSGTTYVMAKFFSTYTAGSTTITAIAPGYMSGQAVMSTVGPIPSQIAVYALPPMVPANVKAYDVIVVQLQDSAGTPARAPIGDVSVTLASSDITVGTVDSSVTIQSGKTYAVARFYTTYKESVTTVTAVSPGYVSGQAVVKTSETGEPPSKLKVYAGPPKVSAEGASYASICVQLEDSQGRIARASKETKVTLTSSNIAVGTVDSSVTIQSGKTYAVTKFYSTYRSGSTQITAIAPGYTSGQATMATFGPIPSRIGVYALPPVVPADKDAYSIIVQLQDLAGSPARDPVGDVITILSSSNTNIGDVNSTAVIPFGDTHFMMKFYSSYKAGSTIITAVASGYASGQAAVRSYIIDPLLSVSAVAYPDSLSSGGETTIRVYVTHDTLKPPPPVPGATIELVSDRGGSFSSITDERNGYYSAVFTAPVVDTQTVCTIMAFASKSGYADGDAQVKVTVNPAGSGGNILIQVKGSDGNAIYEATVLSTSQPSAQPPLSGTTNSEGSVEFKDVMAGSYAFLVDKAGFDTGKIQINVVDGQTVKGTVSLSETPSSGFFNMTYIWVLLFAVLVGVALGAAVLFVRWRSSKRRLPMRRK